MEMKTGEHWRCSNPLCHAEILVVQGSAIGDRNPICICGSVLKKRYVPPVLSRIDFLRLEEPLSAVPSSQRE
jgi:hypothetical protein